MAAGAPYADSLGFLLSQLGADAARRFAELLGPLGISPRAFGVLSNLAADEGQTQQQLADALGIHRNNMVGLVDEMESAGWIERRRRPDDRRAFALHLTPAGRAAVGRVGELVPQLQVEFSADLSDTERATLVSLLRRLAAARGLSPGVHPHLGAAPRREGGRRRSE